jgi:hypothetical protein
MATKKQFDQVRLDAMVEAAQKGPGSPYSVLEGKPFSLSTSVARTLVVGSGLSKSAPEIVEREKTRIPKWLEQGQLGPTKAQPKPAKPKAEPEAEEQHRRKPKRAPRKTGEASATAKAIAASHEPVASA